jgi:hypothetical protein
MKGRIGTTFYEILALEWFRGLQGGRTLSEASYRHLLDSSPHNNLQKVKGLAVRLTEPRVGFVS